jgi:hypothetical protein
VEYSWITDGFVQHPHRSRLHSCDPLNGMNGLVLLAAIFFSVMHQRTALFGFLDRIFNGITRWMMPFCFVIRPAKEQMV